jgi:tetratricopeptide (TPR) repeat protein
LGDIEPLTAYDAATIAQVRGQALFMQDDLPAAATAYQASIATGGLNEERVQRVEYTLLQLAVSQGEHKAIEQALDAAQDPEPAASVFNSTLFAHAYFQLDDIETALEHARTARTLIGQYDAALERMIRYFELLIEERAEETP